MHFVPRAPSSRRETSSRAARYPHQSRWLPKIQRVAIPGHRSSGGSARRPGLRNPRKRRTEAAAARLRKTRRCPKSTCSVWNSARPADPLVIPVASSPRLVVRQRYALIWVGVNPLAPCTGTSSSPRLQRCLVPCVSDRHDSSRFNHDRCRKSQTLLLTGHRRANRRCRWRRGLFS